MNVLILLLAIISFGFGDGSYSAEEYDQRQMSIKPSKQYAQPEPSVQIDRHVISSEDYRRDPSILIAYAKEIKRDFIIEQDLDIAEINQAAKDAAIEAAKNERVHVKAQWCDQTHCDKWEEVR